MSRYSIDNPIKESEIVSFLSETSELASQKQVNNIQIVADVYQTSNNLTNKVEFWDWMNRNFNGAGGNMFSSNSAMNKYISGGQGKADWIYVFDNSYVDLSTYNSYKFVDIEWGEWVEDNAVEIKITKNNSANFGSFKMKVFVKQNENIVAYIKG